VLKRPASSWSAARADAILSESPIRPSDCSDASIVGAGRLDRLVAHCLVALCEQTKTTSHDKDESSLTSWCTACHIMSMTPFDYKPQSGQSIFDAVVFAAKRAFISGDYLPGQEFPSVRALAADLKIHPNTAHKIIQHLVHEGWLEARPGIGTIVCEPPQARPGEKAQLLGHEVEALVVGARRVGLTQAELLGAIIERWNRIDIARGMQNDD